MTYALLDNILYWNVKTSRIQSPSMFLTWPILVTIHPRCPSSFKTSTLQLLSHVERDDKTRGTRDWCDLAAYAPLACLERLIYHWIPSPSRFYWFSRTCLSSSQPLTQWRTNASRRQPRLWAYQFKFKSGNLASQKKIVWGKGRPMT